MSPRAAKSALLQVFIWAIALSYGFSDWPIYRDQFVGNPDGWHLYLRGGVEAPWQYRIGVWIVVDWMNRLFHLKPYDILTLIDVVCIVLALLLVQRTLRNSDGFQSLAPRSQLLAITGVLFLAEYYLAWGHWFQTNGTLPSILFVALTVDLVSGRTIRNKPIVGLLIVILGYLQGFVRADVAVILHAGFLLAAIFARRTSGPFGRVWQASISLLTAVVAGCVQLYLMLIRFPNAHYGYGGVVRLTTNIHPGMWLTMLLAFVPYWILFGLIVAKRYRANAPEISVFVASILYLAVWTVVGLLDEVRIFLPFAFALMPATVLALVAQLPAQSSEEPGPLST